jgi:integrase
MTQHAKFDIKNNIKSNIINYGLHMKANGRAESTIKRSLDILTRLSKICDLDNTQETKLTLANLHWKNTTKNITARVLKCYYKFMDIPFEKPKYQEENTLPFIPTEEELNILISSGNNRTATRLQTLKETGARIGELDKLKWADIDVQRKTIRITAEKGSNSRILPISTQLIDMLNRHPRKNDKIFQAPKENFRKTFEALRKRTVIKLNRPRLKSIHLHTFRHWKATTEYHKTKDIIHVKAVLGHKRIESTMVYINIESALFLTASDEWTSKVAKNETEAQQLIEIGFEYVLTTPNQLMVFRKRK